MDRGRVQTVEAETAMLTKIQPQPQPLTLYVSGENLPGTAARELMAAEQPEREAMLAAFREWMRLDVANGNPSPETIRAYFADVAQHLGWLIEQGLTPATATEEDLKGFRASLVGRYALTTVGRKLAGVRRFYEMALARGALGRNPAAGLRSPADKTERAERIKYLTMSTVQRLLATPNLRTPKGVRDRAMLVLMAMHGLRVIEVHRLDVGDVDMDAGEAGEVRVLGKGSKHRTILLTLETREVLRMWLAARRLTHSASEAVFVTLQSSGEPERISRRGIREMVDGYLRAIGAKRPGISCHSLRHSYATLSMAAGAGIVPISASLGHSSVTTTQVYAKIVDKARHNPTKLLVGLLE